MTVELMFIIAAVVVVLVIIMWPTKTRQSPPKQYPHRLTPVGQMSVSDSGPRFGYRRSPTPAPTVDETVIFEDAGDTEPAVVDVVDLALRVGHELVEAVHTHPTEVPACVDPNRVDATGEPLPPDADAAVCRVEPEAPDADTDATTVDDVPADADRTET